MGTVQLDKTEFNAKHKADPGWGVNGSGILMCWKIRFLKGAELTVDLRSCYPIFRGIWRSVFLNSV